MSVELDLKAEVRAEASEVVTESRTARSMGSGGLDVYATPAMIALMEKAALAAVEKNLPAGASTVGTLLNVKHSAASPLGAQIRAEAVLQETDGRRLVFEVSAWDEDGLIGEGSHERFIIDNDKFRQRTNAKKKSS